MKRKNNITQFILILFLALLSILVILPFLMIVSISISSEDVIVDSGYSIIPKVIDFTAYKHIFASPTTIIQAYITTTEFSIISMVLSVLLMSMLAYPLSRRDFRAKKVISLYVYFTMLFSGGLVPSYILITQYLHLDDTLLVYIIPGLINVWYVFMIRTFFQDIPYEISESAYMDGATDFTIFFKFIIPLSKPVIATVALFTFLGKWNDWNTSMLYINREDLISLQYLLQRIMENIEMLKQMTAGQITFVPGTVEIPSETVRMAMAVVVAGPALLIFPFFQKYFVKGLTVGSVKG